MRWRLGTRRALVRIRRALRGADAMRARRRSRSRRGLARETVALLVVRMLLRWKHWEDAHLEFAHVRAGVGEYKPDVDEEPDCGTYA
jgi:hypothetical protein